MVQRKAPLNYFLGRRNGMYFVRKQRAPLSTDTGEKVGCLWLDVQNKQGYILVSNVNNSAEWKEIGSSAFYYQEAVTSKSTAQALATASDQKRYIAPAAGSTWVKNNIYEYIAGEWVETEAIEGMIVYIDDIDQVNLFDGTDWNNLLSPATTFAGLSDTSFAALVDNNLAIYDFATSKWVNGMLTNGSIDASAGIELSKLEALARGSVIIGNATNVATEVDASSDGYILIGDGTDVNSVEVTGDVAITNAGITTVSDLTMAGEAQGDVLYFDGTNWVVLPAGAAGLSLLSNGAGANPSWGIPTFASATSIANGATLNDAGANDAILSFTTQTVSAPTLTVPDFAGVNDTYAFVTLAQTLVNKTLTAPDINGGTADSLTSLSIRSSGAAFDIAFDSAEVLTGDKTISWTVNDTNRAIDLGGDLTLANNFSTSGNFALTLTQTGATNVTLPTTGTLATLAGTEELTNKTVTSGVMKTSQVFEQTTANYTMTWADPAAARALSWDDPLGDDKFVFRDESVTLTNKTISAASNTISGIGAAETEIITAPTTGDASDTAIGMEFTLYAYVSNQAAAVNIYNTTAPFKFEIIDAYSIDTTGTAGSWKLNNGAAGAGSDITNAVAIAGVQYDIDRPTIIDTSASTIASGGSLSIIPSGGGTEDFRLYIKCIRVA